MALTSLQNQFISASYGQLIQISGSELADGNGSSLSSSILNISASYALTASHALNVPATASYALTASIATSASRADSAAIADQATTASYALTVDTAISASYAATASVLLGSVISASHAAFAISSSRAESAESASFAITASHALNVPVTSSHAVTASFAFTAISASIANTASYVAAGNISGTVASASFADEAERVTYNVQSAQAGTMVKGTPVHITTTTNGTAIVIAASASDAAAMPSHGILNQSLSYGQEGVATILGQITGVDTSAFTAGDTVYVGASGGYTNVKPTGSNLIQNLGVVKKVDASNGTGEIFGTGRANDVPNISTGYAWVGNADQVATATNTASFHVNTASLALDVDSAANISISAITASSATFTSASIGYLQTVTGSAVIIGDSFIILNNDTPTVRYAGIKVQDSGSANTTASFQFDGGTDDWFFEKEVSGVAEFGVALFGPEYTTLGTPIYPAANQLQKGTGGHHITGSGLYEDGTKVYTDLPVSASAGFTGDLTGLATSASFALTASSILGGVENATSASYVSGSGATVDALIVNGTENPTFNVDTSTNQFVYINGNEQLGLNVLGSVEMGDSFNDVGIAYNSFVQGERNSFSSANNAAIIGARESILSGGATEHSVIAGGHTNTITDANRAFIGGGFTNSVNDTLSAIVGGKNNIINSGHTGSVILGGVNITSSNSDTVYVPDLCVTGNISGSTSVDGSLRNTNCKSLTITSNTASLDCTRGNNFLLNITQAPDVLLKIEQPQLAQTINLKIYSGFGSPGAVNWDPIIKFPGGTPFAWTQTTGAEDIVTLVTFNSTSEMFATGLANFS